MEIIKIENLTKIYKLKRKQVVAIKDINLSIDEKDIYGIIGLSGAGKSTLVRCLNYLEKPTSGNIYIDGTCIGSLKNSDLRFLRQKIGMIFQNFNLMEQKNVLHNVLFPLEISKYGKQDIKNIKNQYKEDLKQLNNDLENKKITLDEFNTKKNELNEALNSKLNELGSLKDIRIKRAKELLALVGLDDKLDVYPSQLSGGQKQRVAIARALANNPRILLCDEPTSALDPSTTVSILQLLKDINVKFGITIVIITHEMKVIEAICNKVAIIDESVIKENGLVSEIFSNPKTPIAKTLIYPKLDVIKKEYGRMLLRLEFDNTQLEPVVSNMILKTNVAINIIEANIKSRDASTTYGEMIIQLPNNELDILKVKNYLTQENISFQEYRKED